jgi:hypothetical protein
MLPVARGDAAPAAAFAGSPPDDRLIFLSERTTLLRIASLLSIDANRSSVGRCGEIEPPSAADEESAAGAQRAGDSVARGKTVAAACSASICAQAAAGLCGPCAASRLSSSQKLEAEAQSLSQGCDIVRALLDEPTVCAAVASGDGRACALPAARDASMLPVARGNAAPAAAFAGSPPDDRLIFLSERTALLRIASLLSIDANRSSVGRCGDIEPPSAVDEGAAPEEEA